MDDESNDSQDQQDEQDEQDEQSDDYTSDYSDSSYDGSYDGVDYGGAYTASEDAPSEAPSEDYGAPVDDGYTNAEAFTDYTAAPEAQPDPTVDLTPGPAADFDLGAYGAAPSLPGPQASPEPPSDNWGVSPYTGAIVSNAQMQAELNENYDIYNGYMDRAAHAPTNRDDWSARNPTDWTTFGAEFGTFSTPEHPNANVYTNREAIDTFGNAIGPGNAMATYSTVAPPTIAEGAYGQTYVGPRENYGAGSLTPGRDDWSRTEPGSLSLYDVPSYTPRQATPGLPGPNFTTPGPEGGFNTGPFGGYPFDRSEAAIPTIDDIAGRLGLDIGVDYMTPAQMQQYHDMVAAIEQAHGAPGPGREFLSGPEPTPEQLQAAIYGAQPELTMSPERKEFYDSLATTPVGPAVDRGLPSWDNPVSIGQAFTDYDTSHHGIVGPTAAPTYDREGGYQAGGYSGPYTGPSLQGIPEPDTADIAPNGRGLSTYEAYGLAPGMPASPMYDYSPQVYGGAPPVSNYQAGLNTLDIYNPYEDPNWGYYGQLSGRNPRHSVI